jgi:hypothetical protein
MVISTTHLVEETHGIGVQFLLLEITTALTFLDCADVTEVEETRARNRKNVSTAYETVLRLMPRIMFSRNERSHLDENLELLRKRLLRPPRARFSNHASEVVT